MKRLIVAVFMLFASCDQVGVSVSPAPLALVPQVGAIRVLVPADGIASLYEVGTPLGLEVRAPAVIAAQDGDARVELGPIEQNLPIGERAATSSPNQVALTNELLNVGVWVPVRITSGIDTRICRYQLKIARVQTTATATVVEDEKGQRFSALDQAVVTLTDANLRVIDPCEIPALDFGLAGTLDGAIEQYVTQSVVAAAELAVEANPTETLGLITRRVGLERLSAFATRRATLQLEGEVKSFGIDTDGLEIILDVGTDVERASCAPPLDLGLQPAAVTAPIDPAVVRDFGADFGMAVAASSLERIGRAMTLGGFACQGLEDVRKPAVNQELIPTPDLLLDQLHLGALPLGPWAQVSSSPGSLPIIKTRSELGQIELEWNDLTLDVYGVVQGARVRVLELVTSATVNLRPTTGAAGVVRFDVESIALSKVEITSEWHPEQEISPDDASRWARRILLLVLADQFVFPIPVEPGTPLQVVGAQVRENDLVLYLRFD